MFDAELSNWLINAFNGEWLRTGNAKPIPLYNDGLSKREELLRQVEDLGRQSRTA